MGGLGGGLMDDSMRGTVVKPLLVDELTATIYSYDPWIGTSMIEDCLTYFFESLNSILLFVQEAYFSIPSKVVNKHQRVGGFPERLCLGWTS